MRRRRATEPARDSAAGELLQHERVCATAGAAEQLAAVRSWRSMLRSVGDDPAIGELFLEFARADADGLL